MSRPLGKFRQTDAAQAVQSLVERQDCPEIIFFRHRDPLHYVRTEMSEFESGPEHALPAIVVSLDASVEQIEGELRVTELVFRDEPADLPEHWLRRLTRESQEKIGS